MTHRVKAQTRDPKSSVFELRGAVAPGSVPQKEKAEPSVHESDSHLAGFYKLKKLLFASHFDVTSYPEEYRYKEQNIVISEI
ncbi:hypothetical protein EVAR_26744_1 [Eumeta japonica]|uniref:Uncharacterized protein n=1 Tax=Eumeta variegata TaxID=151549 RepID=A0A4C1XBH5_EUMVA|nr:hypothetical protein EVAR_26744_1 [Eumeta japonica]